MPHFDAPPIEVQRSFEIDDDVKPDAAVIVGQFSQRAYFARIRGIWPDAREVQAVRLRGVELRGGSSPREVRW